MLKALAIASLVGYAHSQSVSVSDYSVATPILMDSAGSTLATTSLAMTISEIIDGAESSTLVSQSMTFKLGADTWAGDRTERLQLLVCAPFI